MLVLSALNHKTFAFLKNLPPQVLRKTLGKGTSCSYFTSLFVSLRFYYYSTEQHLHVHVFASDTM